MDTVFTVVWRTTRPWLIKEGGGRRWLMKRNKKLPPISRTAKDYWMSLAKPLLELTREQKEEMFKTVYVKCKRPKKLLNGKEEGK